MYKERTGIEENREDIDKLLEMIEHES